MKQMKRVLALMLACTLLFSTIPLEALAASAETDQVPNVEQTTSEISVEAVSFSETEKNTTAEEVTPQNLSSDVITTASEFESILSGIVHDINGNGISGVTVNVFECTDQGYQLYASAKTIDSGSWSIDNVWIGDTYVVSYYKAGYKFATNDIKVTAVSGGVTLETVIATLLEIEGLVCNEADFAYETDATAETATITGYTGSDVAIQLPENLGGYPITAIASNTFEGNTTLKTVVFSGSVTVIYSYAFNGCTALTNLYLPNILTKIDTGAFNDCTALESVELPDSVTTLGYGAFRNCTKLSSINYPLSLSSADSHIFEGCFSLTSITVPEGVTSIPGGAFDSANYLEEVILPNTVTEIGSYAFSACTSMKSIDLPDNLVKIEAGAFNDCTALESMELPDSVTTLGYRAFRNCTKLSSINYPLSLSSTDSHIFEGCSSLTSITVPEGVTSIPSSAFDSASYLEEVILPNTVTEIGSYAFSACTSMKSIDLPDNLVKIEDGAFNDCTALESVELPDSVTTLGYRAFRNCIKLSSINYPLSLSSTDSHIFEGCSSLISITVPEGVTAIPSHAFEGCDYLKTVTLPSSLTSIGNSAFDGCTHLRLGDIPDTVTSIGKNAFADCSMLHYVIVNNPNCTIGENAFKNSTIMMLVCSLNSLATVFAIDYDIPYSANDSVESNSGGVLDRTSTFYLADTNSLETNGYLTFTIDYSVSDSIWSGMSSKKVVIKVPAGTELIESSLRLGDTICTDYEYDEDDLKIIIPVTESSCTIKYSAKSVEDCDIRSYALLSYSGKQEVIGIIDENIDIFTIYAEKLTSSRSIQIQGAAPAETAVDIYVDGVLQTTATSSKSGAYLANVTLSGTTSEQMFHIKASCANSAEETMTATHSVKYQQEAPALTGFVLYIDGDDSQAVDLYGLSQSGIRPAITHTGSQQPYKFVITFENPEAIDTLYVTSTRSNIKKSIPAVYDEASGTFIAEGHFDETNKLYVPGTLGLEYNLTHENIQVGEEMDWDEWRGYLSDDLINGAVVESTETEVGSYGTINLSDVSESLADVVLDYSVDLYDEATDGSLGDLMSMVGVVEKIYGYVIPGVDDSRYYMLLDLRDPETVSMVVSDLSGVANKAVQFKLSATDFGDMVGDMSYVDFYDLAEGISNFSTGAGIVYEAFGIYGDYNDLCDEIMQSSTIADKSGALKKAEELRDDQMAFMLLTTLLPLVVTGPMTGPALLFSAMIGSMVALSDVFWQLRVTQIKGENYKIKWHIDPSGYVYDVATNERLQGVIVTAYCIEYDDTDTFWGYTPSEAEYGTLWDALAYNQANPLVTDAEGRYAWDVPEGWWRVKYEKDGYETVWSDWLPVPPPQTEVNIGMIPIATGSGVTVSGTVTSYNDSTGEVTVELVDNTGTVAYSTTVTGNSASYTLSNVVAGTYTMNVSKANHVTRSCAVVVEAADLTQDAKICLRGDVTGDGKITATDYSRLLAHVKKTNVITDEYTLLCADVTGEGKITATDYSRLLAHVKKVSLLW